MCAAERSRMNREIFSGKVRYSTQNPEGLGWVYTHPNHSFHLIKDAPRAYELRAPVAVAHRRDTDAAARLHRVDESPTAKIDADVRDAAGIGVREKHDVAGLQFPSRYAP